MFVLHIISLISQTMQYYEIYTLTLRWRPSTNCSLTLPSMLHACSLHLPTTAARGAARPFPIAARGALALGMSVTFGRHA